jgi:hypothetical protein
VLAAGGALAVPVIALGVVLLSTGNHRSGADYAPFANCPLSDRATDICIFARTESGRLTIGSKTIPLSRTITLQGGVHEDKAGGKETFIGVKDGDASSSQDASSSGDVFSRVPQIVPGGLLGILAPKLLPKTLRERLGELVAGGLTRVTATTELAGRASSVGIDTQNLIEAKGIGLSLPVKVKLSNPFLGEHCYIGSNTHPIVIPLTTGKTSTIGGKPGHAKFEDDYNLIMISEDSLISVSFAAPGAEGCGGGPSPEIDRAVDTGLGLPVAPPGNVAVLNGTLLDANAPAVRASR